ncbi:MAG: Chromate resistance protein ChrB [Natronosporangium sp.]
MVQGKESGRERLLLVTFSTGMGTASLRVQVWRKLTSLGAHYLHDAVCLLPAREPLVREVDRLLARVHTQRGNGTALTIDVPDPAEYETLVGRFNIHRSTEYADMQERIGMLTDEITAATRRGRRASYVQVDEFEADLARVRTLLDRIIARDYFGSRHRAAAQADLDRCAQAIWGASRFPDSYLLT